jgi:hypothetical protein
MFKFTIVLLLSLFTASTYGQVLSLSEIRYAACRVSMSGGSGSGLVFAKDNGKFYILSNHHVTSNQKQGQVQFFRDGAISNKIPAQVIWQRYQDRSELQFDLSILTVDASAFPEGTEPLIIPIAPRSHQIKVGDYIYGSGCPQAKWLFSWEARVTGVGGRILFNRPSIGGESGSSILSIVDGKTMIIGLVTWNFTPPGQQEYGGGVTLEALHRSFAGETSTSTFPKHVVYTNEEKTQTAGYRRIHVRGSDNKIYEGRIYSDGRRTTIDLPETVSAVEYDVQCPGGNCPIDGGGGGLFGGRNNPPDQGGGGSNGGGGGGAWGKPPIGIGGGSGGSGGSGGGTTPVPNLPSTNDAKIKELEAKIKALQDEINKLTELNKASENKITDLSKELEAANKAKEKLAKDLESINGTVSDKDKKHTETITELNTKLETQKIFIGGLEKDLSVTKIESETHKSKLSELKAQLDEALKAAKDKDSSLYNISIYFQEWKEGKIPMWQLFLLIGLCVFGYWFGPKATRYIGDGAKGWVINILREAIKDKILHRDDNSDDEKKKSPKIVEMVYNKEDKKTPVDVTINNNISSGSNIIQHDDDACGGIYPTPYTSERIIEWCKLKQTDGEDIDKTAIFAQLYREAVQKLRKEEFVKNNYKINFQKLAADKIEEYVTNKFHANMTVDKLTRDEKYNEAMICFLYREAVQRLREGKFEIISAAQIAEVIERWVKTEFYKRLGINI